MDVESDYGKDQCFREKQIFDIPGVLVNIETYNQTDTEDIMPIMKELERYINDKQGVMN